MTLALLLAKAGVRTLVLEHNEDFFREYRGEVLMPRFMQAFEQIGLLDVLVDAPHERLQRIFIDYRDRPVAAVRFADVSAAYPYALWMPQPALLSALHARGRTMPAYDLWFHASARDLIHDGGRVSGVVVKRGQEHLRVSARLVVAADGRYSRLRKEAGIELDLDEHDFDVLWFDLPRPSGHDATFRAWLTPRRNFLVLPKYPNLFQCGMITEPSGFAHYRSGGLESMRADLLAGPALIREFARTLQDLTPFHPLEARIALARNWSLDGFLLIGDAAHTCSPAGAIGVAVAVETAIVAADVIRRALAAGNPSREALAEVERLRKPDVLRILALQRRFGRVVGAPRGWSRPLFLLAARIMGRIGILPRLFRTLAVREGPLPAPPGIGFGAPSGMMAPSLPGDPS
jgi:2-polyprenyl-6-methoxyphenol hydroxylase-like FAD-dependent oxidoreductase